MDFGKISEFLLDQIDVEKLNVDETNEALFYVDFLLDQDGELKETIKLLVLKSKLLEHISFIVASP